MDGFEASLALTASGSRVFRPLSSGRLSFYVLVTTTLPILTDPFVIYEGGEKQFRPGVCPVCYYKNGLVVQVVPEKDAEKYNSHKADDLANEHMSKVHGSQWRYLGQHGRANVLIGDVSQISENPGIIEEMYDALMDSFKNNDRGFLYKRFTTGELTHDAQAVVVNESGGSDSGALSYLRLDKQYPSKIVEVRVLWDDSGVDKTDGEFAEFFAATSAILNIFGFDEEETKAYLGLD